METLRQTAERLTAREDSRKLSPLAMACRQVRDRRSHWCHKVVKSSEKRPLQARWRWPTGSPSPALVSCGEEKPFDWCQVSSAACCRHERGGILTRWSRISGPSTQGSGGAGLYVSLQKHFTNTWHEIHIPSQRDNSSEQYKNRIQCVFSRHSHTSLCSIVETEGARRDHLRMRLAVWIKVRGKIHQWKQKEKLRFWFFAK